MFDVAWRGIDAANAAIERTVRQTDVGTRDGLNAGARLVRDLAKANAGGPPRSRRPTGSGRRRRSVAGPVAPGQGPGVRSGKLQRSIQAKAAKRTKAGHYSARVAAFNDMLVANVQEHKFGYLFITPAYRDAKPAIQRLMADAWRKSIRP